jgi:hypothetical protein
MTRILGWTWLRYLFQNFTGVAERIRKSQSVGYVRVEVKMSMLAYWVGCVGTLHSRRRDSRCKQKHVDNPVVEHVSPRDLRFNAPMEPA